MADVSRLDINQTWSDARPADSADFMGSVVESVTIPAGSGFHDHSLRAFPRAAQDPSDFSIPGMVEVTIDPATATEFRVFHETSTVRFVKGGSDVTKSITYVGVGSNVLSRDMEPISVVTRLYSSRAIYDIVPIPESDPEYSIAENSAECVGSFLSGTLKAILDYAGYTTPSDAVFDINPTYSTVTVAANDVVYMYPFDNAGTVELRVAKAAAGTLEDAPHGNRIILLLGLVIAVGVSTNEHVILFPTLAGRKLGPAATASLLLYTTPYDAGELPSALVTLGATAPGTLGIDLLETNTAAAALALIGGAPKSTSNSVAGTVALLASHDGVFLDFDAAGTVTISAGLPDNFLVVIRNWGTGDIDFDDAAITSLTSKNGTLLVGAGSVATLAKRGSTETFMLFGSTEVA